MTTCTLSSLAHIALGAGVAVITRARVVGEDTAFLWVTTVCGAGVAVRTLGGTATTFSVRAGILFSASVVVITGLGVVDALAPTLVITDLRGAGVAVITRCRLA